VAFENLESARRLVIDSDAFQQVETAFVDVFNLRVRQNGCQRKRHINPSSSVQTSKQFGASLRRIETGISGSTGRVAAILPEVASSRYSGPATDTDRFSAAFAPIDANGAM
jgi:hypothetical protein